MNLKKTSELIVKFAPKIGNYLIQPITGDDNKLSGKRILGSSLIISGICVSWYGVKNCVDHLDGITLLVSAILGAGLAFWGLTTWSTAKGNESK